MLFHWKVARFFKHGTHSERQGRYDEVERLLSLMRFRPLWGYIISFSGRITLSWGYFLMGSTISEKNVFLRRYLALCSGFKIQSLGLKL